MHRILIVSDEEFLRDVIRLSLADMQADVRCASDVPEMQRLVRRMLFDLVVVVGTSAFFTGCDVVRTLRPAGLGRPLVYVVAWQQAEQSVLGAVLLIPPLEPLFQVAPLSASLVGTIVGLAAGSMVVIQLLKAIRTRGEK